jgi:hypothetical protein
LLSRLRNRAEPARSTPSAEPVTDIERQWIAGNIAVAQELLATLSPIERGNPLTPQVLDRLYSYWLVRQSQIELSPNDVINAIGLAFGQYLVDRHGLSWVVVTEHDPPEIAVHGQPGDLLLFPSNLVAKRFERSETYFLVSIANGVEDVVRRLRST